jgi:hypothetical protein
LVLQSRIPLDAARAQVALMLTNPVVNVSLAA